MGTDVSLTVLHAEREVAEQAAAAALAELRLVERLMSLYRPDSQLCRLNRDRTLERPHPYLVEVLARGGSHVAADGRGLRRDRAAAVGRCTPRRRRRADCPTRQPSRPRAGRSIGGKSRLLPTASTCTATTAVTLNGIAQGFAADRVLAVLRQHGIRHALVNAGEIGHARRQGPRRTWSAGIQHPRREDA